LDKPVIVCVDDEPLILNSLKMELRRTLNDQYLIETANSGEEALELIEELLEEEIEIPLVISDYIMPQMKGDELLQRIHAITTKPLKVMLTGQAGVEGITNTINRANLYRYIAKPWEPEDLKLTVIEAIRSYFQEKQLTEQNTKLQQANQQLEQSNQEQATLISAYERFVPRQFLKLLGKKSIIDIHLGEQVEKEMSILFSDIRGFTTLSEKMTPQDNFNFINGYLSKMGPMISQYQGLIDKYIGDAIMALFPNQADDAVQAAISMLKALADYNLTRGSPERPIINIGIGINTGCLMLGTVGDSERMDGTVISDAVNLAARVEQLTKTYGTPLLITEHTYLKLTDTSQYQMRVIDCVTVRGKTEPVIVYEVFDAEPSSIIELKLATLEDFERGFQYFHNGQFENAQNSFEKVLQIHPNDKVSQIYLENCRTVLGMMMPKLPKILIVDDVLANIRVLFTFLKKNHFEVLIAEDGEMALESVSWDVPHLILLDVMMPGMNGFEVCLKLKENEKTKDIPVIFMTALSDTVDKVKGFKLGAVDYITKPFDVEEVLLRIKTHLTIHHLQQQLQAKNIELEIQNVQLKEKIKTLTTRTFFS
jgi:DNA-binding response OmpR family regulator/class 3 adenylate cyclase